MIMRIRNGVSVVQGVLCTMARKLRLCEGTVHQTRLAETMLLRNPQKQHKANLTTAHKSFDR